MIINAVLANHLRMKNINAALVNRDARVIFSAFDFSQAKAALTFSVGALINEKNHHASTDDHI